MQRTGEAVRDLGVELRRVLCKVDDLRVDVLDGAAEPHAHDEVHGGEDEPREDAGPGDEAAHHRLAEGCTETARQLLAQRGEREERQEDGKEHEREEREDGRRADGRGEEVRDGGRENGGVCKEKMLEQSALRWCTGTHCTLPRRTARCRRGPPC